MCARTRTETITGTRLEKDKLLKAAREKRGVDIAKLCGTAYSNPSYRKFCREDSRLVSFWNKQLNNYKSGLKPQTFLNSFEIFYGEYCYAKFLQTKITDYLQQAYEHANLKALLELIDKRYRKALQTATHDDTVDIDALLKTANHCSDKHGTIGWVILAKTYIEIASYHHRVTGKYDAVTHCLNAAKQAFSKAKTLISKSSREINNARLFIASENFEMQKHLPFTKEDIDILQNHILSLPAFATYLKGMTADSTIPQSCRVSSMFL